MKSRTTTKKTAATKTTTPAPRCTCEAVPFRPTEAQRAALAPLTGPVGPIPQPSRGEHCDEDRDLAAERVALRSTKGEGDRYSLMDMLTVGLTGDDSAETPLEVAVGALEDLGAELRVLSTALGAFSCDLWPYQATADRTARRAEMVADLVGRMERARKAPQHVAVPPAHEVAGALLTLPGVLSGATAWDRLLRIAERLDVAIVSDENEPTWMAEVTARTTTHATEKERHAFLVALYGFRRANDKHRAAVTVFPFEDREFALAKRLAQALYARDGYGEHVDHAWCAEVAGVLLDRPHAKAVA